MTENVVPASFALCADRPPRPIPFEKYYYLTRNYRSTTILKDLWNLRVFNFKYRVDDPLRLKHFRLIRILMLTLGCWPEQAVLGLPRKLPFYTFYLIFETTIVITGQIMYLTNQSDELDFFTLGNVYITLSLSFLMVFRAFFPCFKKYGDIFNEFFTKFHLRHFRNKDEHAEIIYTRVDEISTYFTVYMVIMSVSGVTTFNVGPLFTNYNAGQFRDIQPENLTLVFSVHYEYPGFRQEDHVLLSALLNVWFSYLCAFTIIYIMDLFLSLIVFQIIGHLRYLRTTLNHFPQPKDVEFTCEVMDRQRFDREELLVTTMKNFDKQENEMIAKKIANCIHHHLLIVNFTRNISNFFGPLLAMNYVYHLFIISILLVECLQGGNALMHYSALTVMTLAQLAQLSIIFEVVHSESERLIDDVYLVPWESMSVSNQKSMCFLLSRVQRPIAVTAMGMTTVGVQTMGSILKTTLSYCAFLKSVDK